MYIESSLNLCYSEIVTLTFPVSVLQIRGGIEDNSKIFFSYFSMKTYVVIPQ